MKTGTRKKAALIKEATQLLVDVLDKNPNTTVSVKGINTSYSSSKTNHKYPYYTFDYLTFLCCI